MYQAGKGLARVWLLLDYDLVSQIVIHPVVDGWWMGGGIAGLRPSVSDSDTPCGGWVVDGWWLKVLVLLDYDLVSQIVIHPVVDGWWMGGGWVVAEGIGIAGLRPSVSDSDTPCGSKHPPKL